jgi:hypothetical protein
VLDVLRCRPCIEVHGVISDWETEAQSMPSQ